MIKALQSDSSLPTVQIRIDQPIRRTSGWRYLTRLWRAPAYRVRKDANMDSLQSAPPLPFASQALRKTASRIAADRGPLPQYHRDDSSGLAILADRKIRTRGSGNWRKPSSFEPNQICRDRRVNLIAFSIGQVNRFVIVETYSKGCRAQSRRKSECYAEQASFGDILASALRKERFQTILGYGCDIWSEQEREPPSARARQNLIFDAFPETVLDVKAILSGYTARSRRLRRHLPNRTQKFSLTNGVSCGRQRDEGRQIGVHRHSLAKLCRSASHTYIFYFMGLRRIVDPLIWSRKPQG